MKMFFLQTFQIFLTIKTVNKHSISNMEYAIKKKQMINHRSIRPYILNNVLEKKELDELLPTLSAKMWGIIILNRPEYIEYFKQSSKVTIKEWCDLLNKYPTLFKHCPDSFKESIPVFTWLKLIISNPETITQCNKLDLLDSNDWLMLLKAQPYIDINLVDWSSFDSKQFDNLIQQHSQFQKIKEKYLKN